MFSKNTLYKNLVECHPSLSRGMVWCKKCRRSQKVNPAECFQHGWPTCCDGFAMTIDSPEEQKKLARK
jgi:hypothetical protein